MGGAIPGSRVATGLQGPQGQVSACNTISTGTVPRGPVLSTLLCKLNPRHCPADEEGSREPPPPDSSSLACRPASLSSPVRVSPLTQ